MELEFEWHEAKAEANPRAHGVRLIARDPERVNRTLNR